MPLDHEWIEQHIPHKGRMCLLDEVLSWDAVRIRCRSSSHRATDNPLRAHGRLGAACGIEYAAQAMAVHGALIASSAPLASTVSRSVRGSIGASVGYLASVRNVALHVARLDDLANYLPARITGFMIVFSVFLISLAKSGVRCLSSARLSFIIMRRDGRKHPSPNSGIPEAAMAGALGVQLGGPSTYGGVLSNKAFIGDCMQDDYLAASNHAVTIVMLSSAMAAFLTISAAALRNMQ